MCEAQNFRACGGLHSQPQQCSTNSQLIPPNPCSETALHCRASGALEPKLEGFATRAYAQYRARVAPAADIYTTQIVNGGNCSTPERVKTLRGESGRRFAGFAKELFGKKTAPEARKLKYKSEIDHFWC